MNRGDDAMAERPFFFPSDGYRLFGMMHVPRGEPRGGILLCHGFTGHHIESQRLFVQAARHMQAAGFAVLRFDYRGSGDSDGEFREGTPATHVDDADAAWRILAEADGVRDKKTGVLGFSLGGYVAACLAGRVPAIVTAALWAAVADPRATCAARNARPLPDGTLDLGGLCVTSEFRAVYDATDPVAALAGSGVKSVFVAHGTQDASVPVSQSRMWEAGLRPSGRAIERVEFPGVGHVFERVEVRRELFERTTSWFEAGLAGPPATADSVNRPG